MIYQCFYASGCHDLEHEIFGQQYFLTFLMKISLLIKNNIAFNVDIFFYKKTDIKFPESWKSCLLTYKKNLKAILNRKHCYQPKGLI